MIDMHKVQRGVLIGVLAGVVDVIPMVIQKLSWDANLSAFFHWVVVGFFIATIDIKLKGALKGIAVAVISLIPLTFLIWWQDTASVIPMSISTLVLGAVMGFLIDR